MENINPSEFCISSTSMGIELKCIKTQELVIITSEGAFCFDRHTIINVGEFIGISIMAQRPDRFRYIRTYLQGYEIFYIGTVA